MFPLPFPCVECGGARDRLRPGGLSGYAYCRDCHNRLHRERRQRYGDLSEEARRRANCRSITKVLQQRCQLPTGACEGCGAARAENHHHWGYDRPTWFVRLCASCHRALETHLRKVPRSTLNLNNKEAPRCHHRKSSP